MCELLCAAFLKNVFEAVTLRMGRLLHCQSSANQHLWRASQRAFQSLRSEASQRGQV